MSSKKLKKYRKMRRPGETPEPFGAMPQAPTQQFVVQRHAARRLHYDFRIEMGGTLRSWAVPKGPSPNPKDKRLAVRVEDHPIEYASFEGNIPADNYGAGSVMLWDRGLWLPVEDPVKGYEKGKILFELRGYKLKGLWALVKIKKTEKEWLLIKERDAYAETETQYEDISVISGLTQDEIAKGTQKEKKLLTKIKKLKAKPLAVGRDSIRPMLASVSPKPFTKKGWLYELKYDGYRMTVVKEDESVKLLTRNGNELTEQFPEISTAISALPFSEFILDGEIVVLDSESRPSFQLLQRRVKAKTKSDKRVGSVQTPASLFCFDILNFSKYDLRRLPLIKRKLLLKEIVSDLGAIRYSDHFSDGKKLFNHTVKLRLEGIIAKKEKSTYESVRSENWLKIRADRTEDFVIVGFTKPQGSRPGIGALLLGFYEKNKLQYVGRVGTGFASSDLKALRKLLEPFTKKTPSLKGEIPKEKDIHWVKPKFVAEVRYKERKPLVRQATFLRLREDKDADQCRESDVYCAPTSPEPKKKKVEVVTSNLEKIFWPKEKYTKGELIKYYQAISPWLLKYLQNRPLMLTRYPDGIKGKSFYQKDAPVFTPDWIRTESVFSSHSEREIRYFVCDNKEALTYIINLGAIPLHLWASHTPTLEQPDWCILDLDPKDAPFKNVIKIALEIRNLCKEIGLESYAKTSGSTGLHILLPLGRKFTHEQSKTLGELIASAIVTRLPKIATVTRNPAKREGKVYVDYLQNGWGKTIAGPFCVRAKDGAPVSMPLKWSEVTPKLKNSQFTIKNAAARMKKMKKDPLVGILKAKPNLPKILEKLSKKL